MITVTRPCMQSTTDGAAVSFSGSVRVDAHFQAPAPARVGGATVTFAPGARTAWHSHPLGQTLFVTAWATMVHATTTKAVDIVLAALLLVGSVTGAQLGARFATKVRPEYLRLALAVLVLMVGIRILIGLTWRPDEIFSVELS